MDFVDFRKKFDSLKKGGRPQIEQEIMSLLNIDENSDLHKVVSQADTNVVVMLWLILYMLNSLNVPVRGIKYSRDDTGELNYIYVVVVVNTFGVAIPIMNPIAALNFLNFVIDLVKKN